MKLLLTSQGITTPAIAEALVEMTGKNPYDTKLAFIPTARNVEPPKRGRYIGHFLDLWKNGFSWIDIVDPSADDVDWQTRLKDAEVIFVAGGNTFHLLNQARKSGLDKWLHKNIKNKVYVGVSAGSILVTPSIEVAAIPPGDVNLPNVKDLSGLNLVNFEIEPHCDEARLKTVEKYAKTRPNEVYALDDQSAIKVVGNNIEVISDGLWRLYS